MGDTGELRVTLVEPLGVVKGMATRPGFVSPASSLLAVKWSILRNPADLSPVFRETRRQDPSRGGCELKERARLNCPVRAGTPSPRKQ